MSIIRNYVAVPQARLEQFRAKRDVFDFVHGNGTDEPESVNYPGTDIDRDWEALAALLTDGGAYGVRSIRHKVVFGGRKLTINRESILVMSASTVATVYRFLSQESFAALVKSANHSRLSELDIYSHSFADDDINLLEDSYNCLFRYYSNCAKSRSGSISYFS